MANNRVPKTVKLYSEPLTNELIDELDDVFYFHMMCRNYFYSRYSGISYYNGLSFRDIRNDLVKNEKALMQSFHLSQRAVNMELSEVIGNIKSMWSNLKDDVKARIRDNDNLSDEDRHYLFYLLKSKAVCHAMLNHQEWTAPAGLAKIKPTKTTEQLHHLLCRYIRLEKPQISHSTQLNGYQLDTQMYTLKNGILSFIGLPNKKRLAVKLTTDTTYNSGNIRIVLDRQKKRLEVHQCRMVKSKTNLSKTVHLGVDKGQWTLLSASSGNEYGVGIGKVFNEVCAYVNDKNKTRNQYHSQVKEINKQLSVKGLSDEKRKVLIHKRDNIIHNNLSNKWYTLGLNILKEKLKSMINHAILEMIQTEKPTLIVLEDLTFKSKTKNSKNKYFNRKVNMWMKGYLDKRLNYHCLLRNIKVEYVSAAHTSKFCAI